jgi:hypothetical protein
MRIVEGMVYEKKKNATWISYELLVTEKLA